MTESPEMSRLRRRALKHGCRIAKSRTRAPQAVDYGTMMLFDIQTNCVVYGGYGFCYEDDVKAFLDEWDREEAN